MKNQRAVHSSDTLTWFKSSYSGTSGGDCVEVATSTGAIHVRDSKGPQGPVLGFSCEEWSAFVAYARTDRMQS
ncbi:DUF397 domain-containing protein [Streptomyces mirabilis]|uniref:DUF397 domain-containing protein n=1 Tax=Streptomyces mirabilis TaxID=68239 RepID=UPI0033B7043E